MLSQVVNNKKLIVSMAIGCMIAGLASAPAALADRKENTVTVSRTTTVNSMQRRNKLSMNLEGRVQSYSASRYLPRQVIATDEDIKRSIPINMTSYRICPSRMATESRFGGDESSKAVVQTTALFSLKAFKRSPDWHSTSGYSFACWPSDTLSVSGHSLICLEQSSL